ncbi:MAG TPA: FGGY family carbohydrate kinase [Roseiflexaceae bacterium]|nr:FGGY family carbohydrate kinase [Roseiflexaceae bacterium]
MRMVGIDLGTSFVKGAVLDLDALHLEHAHRAPFPAPLAGLPAGHHEIDPEAVVATVRETLEALLVRAPDCAGVVLCTQMHSVLLVDAGGAPLTGAVTWLDQRALEAHPAGGTYFDALAARMGAEARRRNGNELRPGLPIATLFWLAEHGALPAGATPLTMADFALLRLCGAPPGVDATNAAASGALDLTTGDWQHAALAALGLHGLAWPRIGPLGEPAAGYPFRGRRIPCYRPVGDAQCALAGVGLVAGELSVNVATGSQVSLLRPEPLPGDFQTRPFFDGQYLTSVVGLPAGRSLNALVALLGELAAAHGAPVADPWPYLLRAAEEAPDGPLRVNLAFFAGAEGAPGAIEGITEQSLTAGQLFRAAFRRMAETYHAAAVRLAPEGGLHGLVFSGGLAHRAPLLRDFIADRLGLPSRLGPEEDTLHGLLALALVCAGRAPSVVAAAQQVRGSLEDRTPSIVKD